MLSACAARSRGEHHERRNSLARSPLRLLAGAPSRKPSFHDFRIEQIYTNADGSVQFVVLSECCGANGEHLWAGAVAALHRCAAATKTF